MSRLLPVALVVVTGCGLPALRGEPDELDQPQGGDAHPVSPGEPWESVEPVFSDVTEATGLDFEHENGMVGERWFVEMAGAGVGLLDYDRDGDLDVYLVQGGPLAPDLEDDGARPSDRLYRNDLEVAPDGRRTIRFVDVTEESGLHGATGYGMGVAVGDVDGDGWPDLYLTNFGANQLWVNDRRGGFANASARIENPVDGWSTSATMFDFDRDGDLDIFVTNYTRYSLASDHACYSTQTGTRDYCGPSAYPPAADVLLRNLGDGTFEDSTYSLGLADTFGPGLGVVSADFNGDHWPDLYVANDGVDNQLWINQMGQRFEDRAAVSGSAVNSLGAAEASMGIAAADFDNDRDLDLFVTHLRQESNTLYENDGSALFRDVTQASGLDRPSILSTGFGVAPLDFDNDGWRDLIVTNGLVVLDLEQLAAGDELPLRQTDQLFRNLGQGRFEDVTAFGGSAFRQPTAGRGLAAGDLDNDGDTDVIVTENNGPARVLLNDVGATHEWIGLDAQLSGGRSAYGARVELLAGDEVLAIGHVHSDGSYCSASDSRVLFGLADLPDFDAVRVVWPDGQGAEWPALESRRYHRLVEGEGQPVDLSGDAP